MAKMHMLFAALIMCVIAAFPSSAERPCYSAIYSFGDSLADTGNFVRSPNQNLVAQISHLPYGQTFFNNPTGRCSNGRLVIDFLAQAFGFPFLPPYLKKYADFSGGVNFAVAGATAMNASFFASKSIGLPWTKLSLDTQITWFKDFRNKYCSATADCAAHFESALFLVGEIGGNDYNYPFLMGMPMEEVATFVPLVTEKIQGAIQVFRKTDTCIMGSTSTCKMGQINSTLMGAGAKKFIVQGNMPIGCLPLYLTVQKSSPGDFDEMGCLPTFNNFSQYGNHLLQRMLHQVQLNHPGVSIVYADYYSAVMEILRHPRQYGMQSNILGVCCGRGGKYNYSPPLSCNENIWSCPNPQQHLFWDGIHLTDSAYRVIAKLFLHGHFTTPPLNLVDRKCSVRQT